MVFEIWTADAGQLGLQIQIPSQGSGERRQAGAGAGAVLCWCWCWCCAVLVSRKWSGKMFSPALMLSQVTLLHVTLRHKSHWYTWHNIDHSRPPISYFCACLEGTLPYSAQFDSVYLLGAVTHWRGRGGQKYFSRRGAPDYRPTDLHTH